MKSLFFEFFSKSSFFKASKSRSIFTRLFILEKIDTSTVKYYFVLEIFLFIISTKYSKPNYSCIFYLRGFNIIRAILFINYTYFSFLFIIIIYYLKRRLIIFHHYLIFIKL